MELGLLGTFLIWVLAALVILYVVKLVLDYMQLQQPFRNIVILIVALVIVVLFLNRFAPGMFRF